MKNTGEGDMDSKKQESEALVESTPEFATFTEAVRDWARAGVDAVPTDLDILHASLEDLGGRPFSRRGSRWLQVSAVLLSAACLLFAISLVQVRIEWQGNAMQFGGGVEKGRQITSAQLSELESRFKLNQDALSGQLSGLLQKTTGLETALHETAALLSERQQAESIKALS